MDTEDFLFRSNSLDELDRHGSLCMLKIAGYDYLNHLDLMDQDALLEKVAITDFQMMGVRQRSSMKEVRQ